MNIYLLLFVLVFVLVVIIDLIGSKRYADDPKKFWNSIYQKISLILIVANIFIGSHGFSKLLEKQIDSSNKLFWLSFAISLLISITIYVIELLILKKRMKQAEVK